MIATSGPTHQHITHALKHKYGRWRRKTMEGCAHHKGAPHDCSRRHHQMMMTKRSAVCAGRATGCCFDLANARGAFDIRIKNACSSGFSTAVRTAVNCANTNFTFSPCTPRMLPCIFRQDKSWPVVSGRPLASTYLSWRASLWQPCSGWAWSPVPRAGSIAFGSTERAS